MIDERRPNEDELPAAIGDPDWRTRSGAVRTLAARRLTAAELDGLVSILGETHHDFSRLNAAIQVLAQTGADVLPPLAELLSSADPDVRCYAALTLGERSDVRAAEALTPLLDDPNANVVMHAVEALGRLRAAAAVDRLMEFVEARHFAFGFSALTALAEIGDERIVPQLWPLLDDPLLQAAAVDAVGALGDRESVERLIACRRAEPAASGGVVRALLEIYDREQARFEGGPEAARRIAAAMEPAEWEAAAAACENASPAERAALVRLLEVVRAPESIAILRRLTASPGLSGAAVAALARQGPAALPALIEALPMSDGETRQEVARLLADMHDPAAFDALAGLLDDDESEVVIAAVEALGRSGDPRAPLRLIELFGHADKGVRHTAVAATLSSAGAESIAGIVAPVDDDSPPRREAAVKFLGAYDARRFESRLLAACDDPDERVRRAAVEHLPILDAGVRRRITEAAVSDRPAVRGAALASLAQAEFETARPLLLDALDDVDAWVRYVALRELLGGDPAQVSLERLNRFVDRSDDVPMRILALAELGARRVDPARLSAFADDGDPDVAAAALRAIAAGRYDEGPALLAKRLADPDPRRRLAAVEAWLAIGGAVAARWLGEAALDRDPAVSRRALTGLAEAATADATAVLLDLAAIPSYRDEIVRLLSGRDETAVAHVAQGLHHELLDVRRAAVEILTRIATPPALKALAEPADDSHPSIRHAARYALDRFRSRPRRGSGSSASEGDH